MRIMKVFFGLLIMLLALNSYAEKFRANEIKFGRPNSTKDKTIHYGSSGIIKYNETDDKFEMSTDGGSNFVEVQAVGNFADSFLSNLLAPTAVNVPLLPVSGNSVDIGSLLLPWGDIMVGYDTNSHFTVVDPLTSASALEIGASTVTNGPAWGINARLNNNRQWLGITTEDNPAGPSNGISIETGQGTASGDSGDIILRTGAVDGSGGAQGEIRFYSSIVDFQNVATVDFTNVTVLGIAGGGGGGGIFWYTPVDADILPSASNTYNFGATNNYFASVNANTGRFATLDNLTGVPINIAQDLTMTGKNITGLTSIQTDSINETTALNGISFNGVTLKNVADPTTPQEVATKNYVDAEIASAVGFDPSAITTSFLPANDLSINGGSETKRWLDGYFQNLKSIENITGYNTSPMVIQTKDQGSALSGNISLESGDANLAGGSGSVLIKSGDNIIGESGSVTLQTGGAGTTRGDIVLNGNQVNVSNTKIINLANPTGPQDAVTKAHLDSAISGLGGGGGMDWSVPLNSNITIDGGNYDFGTTNAPLQNLFVQELKIGDKTKDELHLHTVNGLTPAGYGFETAIQILGGNSLGFALFGDDNNVVDASPTKSFYIETGNKTVGTGNSGDIYLITGTSAGGERGSIILNSGGVSANNTNIQDLADPIDVLDAVNLQYLNTQLATKEGTITAGTTAQYWRGDKTFQTLDTSVVPENTNLYWTQTRFDTAFTGKSTTNLSEGTNLYFTDERVDDRASALIQNGTALTWTYDDNLNTLTGDVALTTFSTTDLSEGSNLYFTDERVDDRASSLIQNGTGIAWTYDDILNTLTGDVSLTPFTTDNLTEGANLYYTQGRFDTAFGAKSTTDLSEGANLYFTDERVDDRTSSLVQNGTGIAWSYDDVLNTLTGNVSLTPFSTTDLTEGTNLYYTQGRFDTAFGAKDTDALSEGATNLYHTDERVDDRTSSLVQNGTGLTWTYDDNLNTLTGNVALTPFSTTDLSEGTNLYYTQGRFDTAFGGKSTTDLSEGTNLYFTNERVDDRTSGLVQDGTGIAWTYDDNGNTLTGNVSLTPFDTDALSEGATNLYYTDTRVDARITLQKGANNGLATLDGTGKIPTGQLPPLALTDVYTAVSEVAQLAISPIQEGDVVIRTDESKSYVHNGGVAGTMADFNELLAPLDSVLSVNSQTGAIVLTTTDIAEGTNLYYTDTRFDTRLGTKTTDNLTEGSTNLYYTDGRFDARLGVKTTDNLTEGATNLYHTDERVDDRTSSLIQDGTGITWVYDDNLNTLTGNVSLATFSTTNLTEGTNLYYTQGRFDTAFGAKSTTDLSEGTNLYFTDERADDRASALIQDGTGLAWTYDDNLNTLTGNISISPFSTSDLTEGTNLYFTEARVRSTPLTGFISGAGTITATDTVLQAIQKLDGNIANAGSVDSVNGQTGVVVLDTDDVSEGVTNLYHTSERVDDRVSALVQNGTGIAWTYDDILNTLTGNVSLSSFSTSELSEGTNLYYTDARAISAPLTGFTSGAGTVSATDSVLQAIQKLDGNIGAIDTGANTSLSNLGVTSINADLIPSANNVRSIGTTSNRFQYVRSQNFDLYNTTAVPQMTISNGGTTPSGKVALARINANANTGSESYLAITSNSGGTLAQTQGVAIETGNYTGADGNSGAIRFVSGSGGTTTGNSGDITLATGSVVSGTRGVIKLDASSLDLVTQSKITNVANPTNAQDVATKDYVDSAVASSSTTSQALTNNVSNQNVTGLVFDKLNVKSAFVKINIERSTDTGAEQFDEAGELVVTYKAKTDTWRVYLQSFGDNAGVTFNVTTAGQIQYSTTNLTGANYSGNLRFSVTRELAQ